jgi:hypothetical protein
MDTSKNRLFLATLMLIGMGFLAGVYLSYTEYSAHGQSVADLKKARDLSGRLLAGSPVADVTEPVALKQGNVDSAQKDLEDLKAHIAKLRETVSGPYRRQPEDFQHRAQLPDQAVRRRAQETGRRPGCPLPAPSLRAARLRFRPLHP